MENPIETEISKLIQDIPPLVDRVNQDYNKFFSGTEKKPPIEIRSKLEKLIDRARAIQRQCQNNVLNQKLQNIFGKYNSFHAIWEKKLKEREQT